MYLKVVSGTGQGQIARVKEVEEFSNVLRMTLVNNLYEELVEESGGVFDSIVSFVEIVGIYNAEYWRCGGFKDDNGVEVNADASVYYFKEGFKQLPSIAIDVDLPNTDKNTISLNPPYFGSDVDKLTGFTFVQTDKLENSQNTIWYTENKYYDNNWKAFLDVGANYDPRQTATIVIGDTRKQDGSDLLLGL